MQNLSRGRQKKDCAGRMYVNMLLLIPYLIYVTFYFLTCQCCQENQAPGVALRLVRDWSKSIGGVGRSREGVGHEVLSLVQGVGRAIFSYP